MKYLDEKIYIIFILFINRRNKVHLNYFKKYLIIIIDREKST